jgi:hypothetical protein
MSTSGNGRPHKKPTPLPPIVGKVVVDDGITASKLAVAVKQKPFQKVADLMEVGVFATLHSRLPFDAASKVARKYGYLAKQIG